MPLGARPDFSVPRSSSHGCNLIRHIGKTCFEVCTLRKRAAGVLPLSAQARRAVNQRNEVDYLHHMSHSDAGEWQRVQCMKRPTQKLKVAPNPPKNETKGLNSYLAPRPQAMCVIFDGCNFVSFGARFGFQPRWHTHTCCTVHTYMLMHVCQITLEQCLYLCSCGQVYLTSWITALCDRLFDEFTPTNQFGNITCYSVSANKCEVKTEVISKLIHLLK